MIRSRSLFLVLSLACGAPFGAPFGIAEDRSDWTSWRGPRSHGSIDQGSFPSRIEADKFAWKTDLPGKGCSTPIVLDGKIYLTAAAEGKDSVLCFDAEGKRRWITTLGSEDPGKHRNGSGSNASPVTDGSSVFVYFKSGTFAAIGLDGSVRWQHDIVKMYGKETLFWDHGTSPVVTAKSVILARMHQGESWLAAFDKVTGELQWKVARNYEVPTECDHGYATPVVIEHQGKESILVWGAEHVTIHDASTGEVSWSCGNFNPEKNKLWPAISTPIVTKDRVIIAFGRNDRGTPRLHGISLAGKGDTTATNHVWKREDVGTFVPTAALHRGELILVRDQGEVESVSPETGKTNWQGAFPKSRFNFYSSPFVAGDNLYAAREDGTVFVGRIGNGKFETRSETEMGEPVIGSPVPLGNRILIRGENHLYCFGD
jgi:outer membrane protein assembly factor BamB